MLILSLKRKSWDLGSLESQGAPKDGVGGLSGKNIQAASFHFKIGFVWPLLSDEKKDRSLGGQFL
jgi:hypothetical protein